MGKLVQECRTTATYSPRRRKRERLIYNTGASRPIHQNITGRLTHARKQYKLPHNFASSVFFPLVVSPSNEYVNPI